MAEDVLQEVFIRIYRKLQWLREPEVFRSWAYQIATRETFRHLKRERRWADQIGDESEIVAHGAAIGTLRGAEGKISAFNGVVLCSGDRHQGKLQEGEEVGSNSRGGVSVQPVRWDRRHRPHSRSGRPSDGNVLKNALGVSSPLSRGTSPARSGKPVVVGSVQPSPATIGNG